MPQRRPSKQPAIVPIQTADKTFSTDPPQEHPCSMPRGSRIAVISDPGRGKTSTILNCLVRGERWAAIYVIHGASGSTEYDLCEHTKLEWKDATPEYWAAESAKHKKQPCAIVVDDCNYADMNKEEKSNSYKTVQSACTHHNFTAFLASHSLTQLIPRIRRACDIMMIWPPTTGGSDQVPYLARTLGLPRPVLQKAFDQAATRGKYSFLCIYQVPPKGRSRIMLDCDTPIEVD
jgi:hypothetical protein